VDTLALVQRREVGVKHACGGACLASSSEFRAVVCVVCVVCVC
jgi:hypothetical protein